MLEAGTLDFCTDHIMQPPNIAPVVRHRWPFFLETTLNRVPAVVVIIVYCGGYYCLLR